MADYRWSRIRGRVTSHPQAVDVAFGLLVVTVILLAVRAGRPLRAEDFLAGTLAFALIAARRRWPLPVFAAVTVASAAFNLHAALVGPLLAANVICTYTVASRRDRRMAAVTGTITVVTVYVAVVIGAGRSWLDPQNAAIVVWGTLAVVVGDATRIRLANLEARRDTRPAGRAQPRRGGPPPGGGGAAADRTGPCTTSSRTTSPSSTCRSVSPPTCCASSPDDAEEALAHVRQAARTVLAELSTVLDVLRSEDRDAEGTDSTTEPPPGLSRLASMLDSLAAAGLRVDHRQEGEARPLPSVVDLAAYRIVQESLTNAHKHGSEPAARLRLDYTQAGLKILVENAAGRPAPDADGCGHGLIGLRERVSSVGGSVRTGRDDGRFTVDAFLPAAPDRQDTPT